MLAPFGMVGYHAAMTSDFLIHGSYFATGVVLTLAAVLIWHMIATKRSGRAAPAPELLQQISSRLDGLARVFEMPRYRGQAGEWLLEALLQDCLPPDSYSMQHGFRSGSRVDALVHIGKLSVAVDAKFPLESLEGWRDGSLGAKGRKAILQHAQSIAAKYIQPSEGTLHYAVMYIPSEAMYSRLFAAEPNGLLRSCLQAGVVPASPGNLFLLLQTVSYGLRGMEFSRNFGRYAGQFEQLRRETAQLREVMATGQGHLRNLSRSYESALLQADRLQQGIDRTAGVELRTADDTRQQQ